MSAIRSFIAFDTPAPIREEMYLLQSELKKSNADVKWEVSEKFHATIKFLGDVEEAVIPNVISRLEEICTYHQPFEVTYQYLGCFPNPKHPRVIWIGCKNIDGKLERLKDEIDKDLLQFGFKIESRAFHPHITLGRVRSLRGIEYLTPMLEKLNFEPRRATVGEIILMRSVLKPQGAEYSVLKTIHIQ